MAGNIIHIQPQIQTQDIYTISIEQVYKRREQRRRRVAKRMAKRFPLFAVEFMQDEFNGYTQEEFEADVSRKSRKSKSMRRAKSPLKRQGRWPLFEKAMSNYHSTKDIKYLREAQKWRNKMFLPFEFVARLNGETKTWIFPSETSVKIIQSLGDIKFSTWDELDEIMNEKLKYVHLR